MIARNHSESRRVGLPIRHMAKVLAICGALCWAVAAQAGVSLEWRVEGPDAEFAIGDTVRVGLYAVAPAADHPIFKSISSMDVLVSWDAAFLSLDCNALNDCPGLDRTSPHNWSFSGFPDDSSSDDLNANLEDGSLYYQALANFFQTPEGTPDGLLVATFEFTAIAPTAATTVEALAAAGQRSVTIVYSGVIGGLDVTDELRPTDPAPSISGNQGPLGDCDGSGTVDLADFATFVFCFGAGGPSGACDQAAFDCSDLNGDGGVDLSDFSIFVRNLGL